MRRTPRSDDVTLALLGCAIAVPLLYYGVQVVAAPFFPGFSFLGTIASDLGSDRSSRPWIFNAGAILAGILALAGSLGFQRALRRLGVHPIVAWLALLVVAVTGLSALVAGIYPLPDPRHGGHPSFGPPMLAVPFVLCLALWRLGVSRAIKAYFIATIVLLLVMVPIMILAFETSAYRGLLQRIFGLSLFVPIGVAAFVLARRIGAAASGSESPDGVVAATLPVAESH